MADQWKFKPGCPCCGCPNCCFVCAPFLDGEFVAGDPRRAKVSVTISGDEIAAAEEIYGISLAGDYELSYTTAIVNPSSVYWHVEDFPELNERRIVSIVLPCAPYDEGANPCTAHLFVQTLDTHAPLTDMGWQYSVDSEAWERTSGEADFVVNEQSHSESMPAGCCCECQGSIPTVTFIRDRDDISFARVAFDPAPEDPYYDLAGDFICTKSGTTYSRPWPTGVQVSFTISDTPFNSLDVASPTGDCTFEGWQDQSYLESMTLTDGILTLEYAAVDGQWCRVQPIGPCTHPSISSGYDPLFGPIESVPESIHVAVAGSIGDCDYSFSLSCGFESSTVVDGYSYGYSYFADSDVIVGTIDPPCPTVGVAAGVTPTLGLPFLYYGVGVFVNGSPYCSSTFIDGEQCFPCADFSFSWSY